MTVSGKRDHLSQKVLSAIIGTEVELYPFSGKSMTVSGKRDHLSQKVLLAIIGTEVELYPFLVSVSKHTMVP